MGGFEETKKRNSLSCRAEERFKEIQELLSSMPVGPLGLHSAECHFDVLNNLPNIHFPIRGYYTRSVDLLFILTELTAATWASTEVQSYEKAFLLKSSSNPHVGNVRIFSI